MGALLALIPGKDWLYGGIIVALLVGFGWYTHRERSIGAANELAAVQTASAKEQENAREAIIALNAHYAATVAAIQETQNVQLKAAAADSATLAGRLRNYEANRSCPRPVLAGSPAAPTGSASSPGSDSSVESGSVESDLEALIAAAEHDNAAITAERAERDSLTGK